MGFNYIEMVAVTLGLSISILGSVSAFEYTLDELRYFDSPLEFRTQFKYNFSGLDKDGAPVWTADLGSWDFRRKVNEGGETLENFTRHFLQMFVRMRDSSLNGTVPVVFIGDIGGFDSRQALHIPTVTFIYRVFRFHAETIGADGVKKVYAMFVLYLDVCMVNPWFIPLFNIGKVFLGKLVDKIELHPPDSNTGIERILQHVAQDQIPEKYGGSKDFVALRTFG